MTQERMLEYKNKLESLLEDFYAVMIKLYDVEMNSRYDDELSDNEKQSVASYYAKNMEIVNSNGLKHVAIRCLRKDPQHKDASEETLKELEAEILNYNIQIEELSNFINMATPQIIEDKNNDPFEDMEA